MEEMEGLVNAMPWILGGLVLIIALAALWRPLKWVGRVLLRSAAGLAVLFAFSKIGGLLGFSLGVNVINALIIGVLVAPGFGLLLLVNWALAI